MPSFDQLTLPTGRLLLRPLVERDAEPLFGIFSDAKVMEFWSTSPWTSVAQAEAAIAKDAEGHRNGTYLRLGVETRDEHRLVGTCTLYNFHEQCRRAEIGYALASVAWGQGIMREALSAVVDFAFGDLALHRLEADIDPRNVPSGRILERLGFRKEGRLRERWIVNGVVSDTDLYGLLRSEWPARPAI